MLAFSFNGASHVFRNKASAIITIDLSELPVDNF